MKKDFLSQEVTVYCRILFRADAPHCRRAPGFHQGNDFYAQGVIRQYFFF
jgi:hypothetical protein